MQSKPDLKFWETWSKNRLWVSESNIIYTEVLSYPFKYCLHASSCKIIHLKKKKSN